MKKIMIVLAMVSLPLSAQSLLNNMARSGTALQISGAVLIGYGIVRGVTTLFDPGSNQLSTDLVVTYKKYLDTHEPDIFYVDRFLRITYFEYCELERQFLLPLGLIMLGKSIFASGTALNVEALKL